MESSPEKHKNKKEKKSSKKKKKKSRSRSKSKSGNKDQKESLEATASMPKVNPDRRMSVKPKTLSYVHTHESGPASCCFEAFGCKFHGTEYTAKEHLSTELVSHVDLLKREVDKMKDMVGTVLPTFDELVHKFDNVYKRHNILHAKYGSHLLWKISGYAAAAKEAEEGKKTVIFSPPFSVSKNGYRLMSSIALHGDGKARGKFVSVFVSILRSPNDRLLVWPFDHNITITLLDQNADLASRHDNVFTIIPNPVPTNEMFLGRPSQERNPSFGAQQFMPLHILHEFEYIKDDTMFIKIQIDDEHMNYL